MYCMLIVNCCVGIFGGQLVVLMWLLCGVDVICVVQIMSWFLGVYGVLIYIGYLWELGIDDLNVFEFGDVVMICDGELLVFWVCGVML